MNRISFSEVYMMTVRIHQVKRSAKKGAKLLTCYDKIFLVKLSDCYCFEKSSL